MTTDTAKTLKSKGSISFALMGIQTHEFAIIEELYSTDNPKVDYQFNARFGIKSLDVCEIACVPEVSFMQDGKPFIKIKVGCYFKVKPEQWKEYINEVKKTIIFPKGFTDHLLVIATGTLRGVLHAKTEGTQFNRFILPTINVSSITADNIELSI